MSDLAGRLREVRLRMGMSQTEFGALGGVSKGSQIAYERGRAEPGAAYLARLSEAGVNVVYLLTGRMYTPLDPKDDFYRMLDAWLRLEPDHRAEVLTFTSYLLARFYDIETPEEERERHEHSERVLAALMEGRPVPKRGSSS